MQTGYDALSMDIVEELIQEVLHESGKNGPHWVITVYSDGLSDVEEGNGSTSTLINMIRTNEENLNKGIYIKYPKGRFMPVEKPFTNDWSIITTETAIIKVVFPSMGTDTVWLIATQHPFP